jgi:transposase
LLDTIENRAHAPLKNNPDYQQLRRIPGIGSISALTILAEAGDLRRFSHYQQFLKFREFDLATEQSGQFREHSRLSKRGNARLRCAFWIAASVAVRMRENGFRVKFERYFMEVAVISSGPDECENHTCGVIQAAQIVGRKACVAVAAKIARS